ncbi:MAG: small-conductance mechanosensitive ion channel [Deltaproteobacteria bacterium]|nr:small-conductance mechanosensitive ion channel [Deltaproteobacteria bacterium]
MEAINDWGEAIMTSMTGALMLILGAIPKIIGFVIILVIGWFIAGLIARAVTVVLRKINFNDLAQRSGFSGFIERMGVRCDSAGIIGETTRWFVRLLALIVAFDALGLPAVSQVLHQLLLWLPNLVVALVILVIAGLAANAFARLVRGATAQAGFGSAEFIATVARISVWAFGIVVAVNQIGVATALVNTLFMGFVGALALALGLSFGLGGRDTAGEIVRSWYERGRGTKPRLVRAAEAGQEEMRSSSLKGDGGHGEHPRRK